MRPLGVVSVGLTGPRRFSIYPRNGHRQRRSAGLFRAMKRHPNGSSA
jgi:hypothetical protein